jgi:tRNA-binding protein
LTLDFGPGGTKRSSAQLPPTYPDPAALLGRLVIAVVNFAPRNIAGFESQVLILGALPDDGLIPLLSVDQGAQPGDAIG